MTETENGTPETREFELPIRLTIGEREIEVPITVAVTFDELTRIVERHLTEQEDIYAQLMEHYAEQANRRRGKRPEVVVPEPPAPAPAGGKSNRKKTAPEPETFAEEELAAWRGQPEPALGPRGRKSRERLLWEAANPPG